MLIRVKWKSLKLPLTLGEEGKPEAMLSERTAEISATVKDKEGVGVGAVWGGAPHLFRV